MITGGASSRINPLKFIRYSRFGVLSKRNEVPEEASRPFDAQRDGFVVGEGAGILVLEAWEHAQARKAHIYGEVTGYGSSSDIMDGGDNGKQVASKARAMKAALADARTEPASVELTVAHANAIPFVDRLETAAIKAVWGAAARSIPVISVKGHMGDLGAASGVLNIITALLSMQHGIIPPTLNLNEPDPECDLDYVPRVARRAPVQSVLCNSFDYLGQNVSLCVKAGRTDRPKKAD
jgi:3-oxoacyl-[acyl-carrier-protein] synthase II